MTMRIATAAVMACGMLAGCGLGGDPKPGGVYVLGDSAMLDCDGRSVLLGEGSIVRVIEAEGGMATPTYKVYVERQAGESGHEGRTGLLVGEALEGAAPTAAP